MKTREFGKHPPRSVEAGLYETQRVVAARAGPEGADREARLQPFIAETEHGHWLGAEVDGCELKGRFVGHDPFPLVRGPMVGMIGRGGSAAPSFCCFYRSLTSRRVRQGNAMPDFGQCCLLLLLRGVWPPAVPTSTGAHEIDELIWTDHYNDLSILRD